MEQGERNALLPHADQGCTSITRTSTLLKYLSFALFVSLPFAGFFLGTGWSKEENGTASSDQGGVDAAPPPQVRSSTVQTPAVPNLPSTSGLATDPTPDDYGMTLNLADRLAFTFLDDARNRYIAHGVRFIDIDLEERTLAVYDKGIAERTLAILAVGKDGSLGRTPIGLYKVERKDKDHISSFDQVHQPWSVFFHGNFSIHGQPFYSDSKPVSSALPGEHIRLSTEDAAELYKQVEDGVPVVVRDPGLTKDRVSYVLRDVNDLRATTTARASLAVDMVSGAIIAGGDVDTVLPIASIAKLMTALVAIEQIDLDRQVAVPERAIVYTSKPRYTAGQVVNAYDLIYPLLTESSNEAALTIEHGFGGSGFIGLMNAMARSLGMDSTTFVDAAGRGAGNVSTTADLAVLARYIFEYRAHVFAISAGRFGGNSYYGTSSVSSYSNYNHYVADTAFVGGKTGKTNAAGETMLAVFLETFGSTTRPIAYVVLGSEECKRDIGVLRDQVKRHSLRAGS